MEIAVLGWGSLIQKVEPLRIKGRWHFDGPMLPVEFGRITRVGKPTRERLTLCIHEGARQVPVMWAKVDHDTIGISVGNLAGRIGCTKNYIGTLITETGEANCNVIPDMSMVIRNWAATKGIDAVIWTDLPSNFFEKTRHLLTEYNVIQYLKELPDKDRELNKQYFESIPTQIRTNLRKIVEKEMGWGKKDEEKYGRHSH